MMASKIIKYIYITGNRHKQILLLLLVTIGLVIIFHNLFNIYNIHDCLKLKTKISEYNNWFHNQPEEIVGSTNQSRTNQITIKFEEILDITSTNQSLSKLKETRRTTKLFKNGYRGYKFFRIPALVYHQGVALAFCEGRHKTDKDNGPMEIVMRRGFRKNNSLTFDWENMQVLKVTRMPGKRSMNPVPIVDPKRKVILLIFTLVDINIRELEMMSRNDNQAWTFVTESKDSGKTWARPRDITNQILKTLHSRPAVLFPSPGHGIYVKQLDRLIFPAYMWVQDYTESRKKSIGCCTSTSFVVFSDDGGKTWTTGGQAPHILDKKGRHVHSNEAQVAELDGGKLCLFSKTLNAQQNRLISYSINGGKTFFRAEISPQLYQPSFKLKDGMILPIVPYGGCQASVVSFPLTANYGYTPKKRGLLISSPAIPVDRRAPSVRMSIDDAVSWTEPWIYDLNYGGYSDIAYIEIDDYSHRQSFAVLYESGLATNYESINFKTFTIDSILDATSDKNIKN